MNKVILIISILICVSSSISSQVVIDYNEIEGNYIKEDIYSFSIFNRTELKVEALLQGRIINSNEELIYKFEVPNLIIEKGKTIFNPDSFNIEVVYDNYSMETIKDGYKIECSLLHPLDRKSVIAKYSTYYIANEVGIEKGNKKNLALLIRDGFQQKLDYDIKFYQPLKSYETREFIIGADNIFNVQVSKFKFPYGWLSKDVSPSNIKVYSDDMSVKIKRNQEGSYKLKIDRAKKNIRLKVKVIEDDYFFVREFFFGLKELRRPRPYISNKNSDRIGNEDITKFDELKVKFDKELINVKYKIVKFDILIIKKTGLKFKHENQGSKLQIKVKDELKELEKGDILIIDKIICEYPRARFLENIIVHIE